jgi:hypothetical protein
MITNQKGRKGQKHEGDVQPLLLQQRFVQPVTVEVGRVIERERTTPMSDRTHRRIEIIIARSIVFDVADGLHCIGEMKHLRFDPRIPSVLFDVIS